MTKCCGVGSDSQITPAKLSYGRGGELGFLLRRVLIPFVVLAVVLLVAKAHGGTCNGSFLLHVTKATATDDGFLIEAESSKTAFILACTDEEGNSASCKMLQAGATYYATFIKSNMLFICRSKNDNRMKAFFWIESQHAIHRSNSNSKKH